MPVMLERWNDDKMDALDAKVDGLGARLDERFKQVDMRFERVEGGLSELRKDMKAGFDRMLYAMLTAAVLIIVALIGT